MSFILSLLISFNFVIPFVSQQKPEPQFKLVQFHMAILKKGPKWSATRTKETEQMHQAHLARAALLLESGKAIVAGPLTDDGEIRGIYIFRAPSAEEAKAWANDDPAVASGHLVAEMHPWWSEDVFKKANTPLKLTTAYLAFLVRGDKWTPEKTPATEELQKGPHGEHHSTGRDEKAGRCGSIWRRWPVARDLCFRVDTLAEAKALTETDPAVKAGRLALDLHPWQVPEGILP